MDFLGELLFDSGKLRFKLLVDGAVLRFDTAAATADASVGGKLSRRQPAKLTDHALDLRTKCGVVVWMDEQAQPRSAASQFQRFSHQLNRNLRLPRKLAPADARRHRRRQLHRLPFPV